MLSDLTTWDERTVETLTKIACEGLEEFQVLHVVNRVAAERADLACELLFGTSVRPRIRIGRRHLSGVTVV